MAGHGTVGAVTSAIERLAAHSAAVAEMHRQAAEQAAAERDAQAHVNGQAISAAATARRAADSPNTANQPLTPAGG